MKDFLNTIVEKHLKNENYPSTSEVIHWVNDVLFFMFPEQSKNRLTTIEAVKEKLNELELRLKDLLVSMEHHLSKTPESLSKSVIQSFSKFYDHLLQDISAILLGDPAAQNEYEIVRAYPGFYAIFFYRIAHSLLAEGIPILPRFITEYAHSKTGIDIHPGADIQPGFCIDHGTGVVIGGTAIIGKNVKVYQGVTLGALSVSKDMASTKRHPTIEDNVVIYANATILGGDTIIGKNSIIGGSVWITKSVAENSIVYHSPQIKLKNIEEEEKIESV